MALFQPLQPPPRRLDGAPHPVLHEYYAALDERPGFVRELFDRTARHYDAVNLLLSFGSGIWSRTRALRRAGLAPGMRVLDVATGTGLTARAARRVVGNDGHVIGVDVSVGMLDQARSVLGPNRILGDAARIPLADASCDFLCIGYAIRHVGDLGAAFGEFNRVLRPGGRAVILEISRIQSQFAQKLARIYLGRFIPWLCMRTTGSADTHTLMRYYWDTIEHCVPPETLLEAMRQSGFSDADCTVELGVFRAYSGTKQG